MILVIYNGFGYLQWFWLFTIVLVIYNDLGYLEWFFGYLQWFSLFTMILVIYRKVSHVISIKNSTTDTSHILKESTEFSLVNGKFLKLWF